MGIQKISVSMEKYVMPVANRLGNECHLRAIRDAFMSLLPINFMGGIAAVISSLPLEISNSIVFSWINALTLGAMSIYVCIGIIHFLCKSLNRFCRFFSVSADS